MSEPPTDHLEDDPFDSFPTPLLVGAAILALVIVLAAAIIVGLCVDVEAQGKRLDAIEKRLEKP